MKARSLFYFIVFFCLAFSGCKKEEIDFKKITGHWYVERYTLYDEDGSTSGYDTYAPLVNYEAVGSFDFYNNGTGEYTFDNQKTPFTYTISENTNTYSHNSSFNGITTSGGSSASANVVDLTFDKSQIFSPTSPIVIDYNSRGLEHYEVFTRTQGTLLFKGKYSIYSGTRVVEFVLTKQ